MSSPKSNLESLEKRIQELPINDLKNLQTKISEFIKEREEHSSDEYQQPGRQLLEKRQVERITYQLEKIKCGKPGCRCAQNNEHLHGPYWYLYRWNGHKVISQYVGKKLPADLTIE